MSEHTTSTFGQRRRRRRSNALGATRDIGDVLDIPVTPLIDVMMCLLVIFMIITPVITYYGARVPEAANPQRASVDDALSVGMRADGTIFIGEDTVVASELAARLRALYDVRPGDHLLYLWADGQLKYDDVLDVIDAAQRAGVRTVGAIVSPKDGGKKPTAATAPQ
jgi:biopolymer transport protein ExbD